MCQGRQSRRVGGGGGGGGVATSPPELAIDKLEGLNPPPVISIGGGGWGWLPLN